MGSCKVRIKATGEEVKSMLDGAIKINTGKARIAKTESSVKPGLSFQHLPVPKTGVDPIFSNYFPNNAKRQKTTKLLEAISRTASDTTIRDVASSIQRSAEAHGPSNPRTSLSVRRKYVLNSVPATAEESVMHYFLAGGKVSEEDFVRYTGLKGKDLKDYQWMLQKGGPKMDTVYGSMDGATEIFSSQEGSMDGINVMTDVMTTYSSVESMVEQMEKRMDSSADFFGQTFDEHEISSAMEELKVNQELEELLDDENFHQIFYPGISQANANKLFLQENTDGKENTERNTGSGNQDSGNPAEETSTAGNPGNERQVRARERKTVGDLVNSPVVLSPISDWELGSTSDSNRGAVITLQNRVWSNQTDFEASAVREVFKAILLNGVRTTPGNLAVGNLLNVQMTLVNLIRQGNLDIKVLGTYGAGYSVLLKALTGKDLSSAADLELKYVDPYKFFEGIVSTPGMLHVVEHLGKLKQVVAALNTLAKTNITVPEFRKIIRIAQNADEVATRNSRELPSLSTSKQLELNAEYQQKVDTFNQFYDTIAQRKRNEYLQLGSPTEEQTSKLIADLGEIEQRRRKALDSLARQSRVKQQVSPKVPQLKSRINYLKNILNQLINEDKVQLPEGIHELAMHLLGSPTHSTHLTKGEVVLALEEFLGTSQIKAAGIPSVYIKSWNLELTNHIQQTVSSENGDVQDNERVHELYMLYTGSTSNPSVDGFTRWYADPKNILIKQGVKDVLKDMDQAQEVVKEEITPEEIEQQILDSDQEPVVVSDPVAHIDNLEVDTPQLIETSHTRFVQNIKDKLSSEDPYERTNIQNEDIQYIFIPAASNSSDALVESSLDPSTPFTEHRLIVHPNDVAKVNEGIRARLFTNPGEFEVGDIILVNGELQKIKSIDPVSKQYPVSDNSSKKMVTFSVRQITFTNGKKISVLTDSTEGTLDKGISLLTDSSREELFKKFHAFSSSSDTMPQTINYGYAISSDKIPSNLGTVLIDENSFYEHEPDTMSRNTSLAEVFSKVNKAVIFSNRIVAAETKPNPVKLALDQEEEQELTELFAQVVKPDGLLEPLNLGPEYTAIPRKYAVDGMVSILESGAIGITKEQILKTKGLPAQLTSEKYFYHNGNLYINLDAIGEGAVMSELKGLFLEYVQANQAGLFSRISAVVKQTPEYAFYSNLKKDGELEEDELVIQVFSEILDRQSNVPQVDGFKGTMNEFINSVNQVMENIDPKLNWRTGLTELAIRINEAVSAGNVNFTKLLAQPDLDAAKLATGQANLTSQMNDILIDLIGTGKLIKTCK